MDKSKKIDKRVLSKLKELECIKEWLKPIYEFEDFGNYPALVRVVKDLRINLAESEFMCDV